MWYVNVKWYLPFLAAFGRLQTRFACLNPHNRHRLTPYSAGIATVTTTSIIIAGLRANLNVRIQPPRHRCGPSSRSALLQSAYHALSSWPARLLPRLTGAPPEKRQADLVRSWLGPAAIRC